MNLFYFNAFWIVILITLLVSGFCVPSMKRFKYWIVPFVIVSFVWRVPNLVTTWPYWWPFGPAAMAAVWEPYLQMPDFEAVSRIVYPSRQTCEAAASSSTGRDFLGETFGTMPSIYHDDMRGRLVLHCKTTRPSSPKPEWECCSAASGTSGSTTAPVECQVVTDAPVHLTVIFADGYSKSDVAYQVIGAVRKYIGNLPPGEVLRGETVIKVAREASWGVVDVEGISPTWSLGGRPGECVRARSVGVDSGEKRSR